MRFLLDQNLSARLATRLAEAGHDAVHVAELGLSRAGDLTILDRAAEEDRVLISPTQSSARCSPRRTAADPR